MVKNLNIYLLLIIIYEECQAMAIYKYNPENYVDYLCESMNMFHNALPQRNRMHLKIIWNRMFFDTKQAVKEHLLSSRERDDILEYYGGLIPDV